MHDKLIAISTGFLLAALLYVPTFWLVYRKVHFHPATRFIYALTAAPVFVGLLLANIALLLKFWPAIPQLLQGARPFRDRQKIFVAGFAMCALALFGSWLWYRFFAWLNRLHD